MKIKLLILLAISLFVLNPVYCQDLIVKQSGDSINCKIDKFDKGYIYYFFKDKGKIKNNSIHTSEVVSYVFGYYNENPPPENVLPVVEEKSDSFGERDYTRILIGINGGIGNRTKEIKNTTSFELGNYHEKLKRGTYLSADVSYFFHKYMGVGLKFSLLNSSNKVENISYTDTLGNVLRGKISDNIRISYLAFYVAGRYEFENSSIYLNLSLGNVMYRNDNYYLYFDRIISGSTFGVGFDLGYDFYVSRSLAIGAKLSYNSGELKTIKRDGTEVDLGSDSYVGLQNFDISVGLKLLIR